VLVDDYLGNIREYLAKTNGIAILVDQPWNRDRRDLQKYIKDGRLTVVSDLAEVPSIIEKHMRAFADTRGQVPENA
jgi:hypothetical protein